MNAEAVLSLIVGCINGGEARVAALEAEHPDSYTLDEMIESDLSVTYSMVIEILRDNGYLEEAV